MTDNEQMEQELVALRAQVAEQEKALGSGLRCRVSPKGAVSLYGLGRFPVSLYRNQWQKIFAAKAMIEGFMEANKENLADKAKK